MLSNLKVVVQQNKDKKAAPQKLHFEFKSESILELVGNAMKELWAGFVALVDFLPVLDLHTRMVGLNMAKLCWRKRISKVCLVINNLYVM